jgi:predicted negative regulator of RcsB-dependent stress response
MTENSFEARYDISSKSKIRKFYDSNKTIIFVLALFLIFLFVSVSFYLVNKENKKNLLSQEYIQAKIYIKDEKKTEAIQVLKKIIFSNDDVYSTLSFFLILNNNLIKEQEELSELFDHLIKNIKFEDEIKNLMIFKKALFNSNFIEESKLLNEMKPLMNEDSLWKPHVLLLLGDYFSSKKEYLKAKEFYMQIINTKSSNINLYKLARSRISLINNDQ